MREVAPKVRCPTLVFHAKEDPCFPFDEGRLLASLIPNAQFVALESKNHLLIKQDPAWPKFVAAVRAFLKQDPLQPRHSFDQLDGLDPAAVEHQLHRIVVKWPSILS